MAEEDFDLRMPSQGEWEYVKIIGREDIYDGPWKFVSDGTIGAYPRFVNQSGLMIPWHSVEYAYRKPRR